MNRILKAYLKRLTNLSSRNKSLLLTNLSAEQFLDLHDIDFLLGKPSVELVRQLVQRKSRIVLCDVLDPRFEKVNEVSKRLRKIARTEHFIEEERGARDLYVGYPFVKGKLADGTPIHAPLLFFPVTLTMEKEQWWLSEREESSIHFNQSFALAYAHFNESQITDDISEKSFDEFSKDFLEFRTQLYEWLKESPFKINFNQQLFEEKLLPFHIQKSSDLLLSEKNGELKLFPEAVLGIFPQAGSYLVPDYNALLASLENGPVKIPLIGNDVENNNRVTGKEDFEKSSLQTVREEDVLTPFPIDESQEEIILAVKSGKSLVVQGPPGSGKSQLICNLMADFASKGKRVLLVCQKRAALDVVYRRLETIGMGNFVALIHDFKNDRPALYQQLAAQIEKVEEYRKQNYSLDAVFIERQFTQESRGIDKNVEDLETFRKALFDETECGVSVKELYLTSDPKALSIDARSFFRSFRIDSYDNFLRRLKVYAAYTLHIAADHVWATRRSFARFGIAELRNMEDMFSDWPEAYAKQMQLFERLTGLSGEIGFLENRSEVKERLNNIVELIRDETTFDIFKKLITNSRDGIERLAFIRQTTDTLEGFIAEDGIELTADKSEISMLTPSLKKAIEAKQSAISGTWWDLFGKNKKEVERLARNNNISTSSGDLSKLERKIRNRVELESWLENRHLAFDPDYFKGPLMRAEEYLDFFRRAESAADAVVRASITPWYQVITTIARRSETCGIFGNTIADLLKWMGIWDRHENAMTPYLLTDQIQELIREPGKSQLLLNSLKKDFDSLADMDRLWEEMSAIEQETTELLTAASRKNNFVKPEQILDLFENSIRLAWIEHIETKYPHLRSVTSLKMNQWEDQLQKSVSAKQKLSSDIAGIKLRESTYQDIEKNRLGNRITYRELGHQVTKKRKIWPIRKLLENYTDEVFAMVPCWMASPEAVSAIFPMQEGLFDLVVFDEASQCYAEYGLPAAFRGSQVVVTGDSKQLAPNDLYKIRYEDKREEEEYSAALEIESLLDLSAQSLDQYQLRGHYRSLSLDLIEFSNHHFYKNSLRLLPDFNKINSSEPGIKYIKTDGIWKNNVNLTEVEKVIELVGEQGTSGKSIGVVTFNFYQQQAIQERLEREGVTATDLFVKNIENVQGDERDIIIFSMGYAPDEKGKLAMHFGSLNGQGGENRLNVAVTRARERVFFVTSLWPSQLTTDQTVNAGPKLLKAYLQYAMDVSEGKFTPKPLLNSRLKSNWLLKDRLVDLGDELEKELPFSDLTIKKEGVYKGLVLTDDDLYYHSKSSKEPHAYLPLLLQQKNWPFRRFYSRELWSGSLDQLELQLSDPDVSE
jgi:energy-coupling factor transporter ATP-binding protein EcfA2